MNVQELIDELEKVSDKTLPVAISDAEYVNEARFCGLAPVNAKAWKASEHLDNHDVILLDKDGICRGHLYMAGSPELETP